MSQAFSVKECLRGYTSDTLGAICDKWQLAAASKQSRIRAIERILQDPLHVQRIAETLSPDVVRLLSIVGKRGAANTADLLQVPGLYSLKGSADALREAITLGFLLVCPHERAGAFTLSHLSRDPGAGEASPQVFLLDLAVAALPAPAPLAIEIPTTAAPQDTGAPPRADHATTLFLETLRIVEAVIPRVTANGSIHKTDEARAKELAEEAGLPHDGLSFSLMVARQSGCIEAKQGRLVTTPKAAEWAAMGSPDRMRALFTGYLAAEDLPDVKLFFPQLFAAMEEHLKPGTLRRGYHRELVAAILREQPEGAWHTVDAFAQAAYQQDRNIFLLEERWRAIHSNAREATSPWKDRQWQLREKRLLCWMVQSLLHDMAVVELADEGRLFRVTPSGRYALGVGPMPESSDEATSDALIVQPDFEVIAYRDRCTADLLRKLDTFCERVRAGEASTYRITQDSVYHGVRSGTPMAAFMTLLESHSRQTLPSNVREQFAAWQRKLESIQLHPGCDLLECADAEEAEAISTECDGSKRIGDRYVLLNGVQPEVDARVDYRRDRRRCLQQEDGLIIRLPWERCDLFMARRLEEMGDLTSDGSDLILHLDKNKLKRREDWNLYAAQLESLTEEPLAARYRVALRAWGGDLGSAHSGSATIVRFDSPELCEASLEFSEVSEYIEGRLGLFALVIFKGKLAKFKKALRQRGIIVKNDDAISDEEGPAEWAVQWAEEHRRIGQETEVQRRDDAIETEEEEEIVTVTLPSYSPRIVREILEDAIARRRPVLIEYHSAWSTRPSVRQVDPVTLDLNSPTPSLSGFCHQHEGPRTFKLARVSGVRILEDESF
jgi:hypothetical protein